MTTIEEYIEGIRKKATMQKQKRGITMMLTAIMVSSVVDSALLHLGWLLVFAYGVYLYEGE